jgi:hypothetical protein
VKAQAYKFGKKNRHQKREIKRIKDRGRGEFNYDIL